MRQRLKPYIALLLIGSLVSCSASLKPYERVYVNDQEMQMNVSSVQNFGYYVFSIREGSLTAIGQKGGGGCGCN